MSHTPGPWEVAYLDKNGQAVVKGEHIEVATCWHHSVGSIEIEMGYNAALIAAAPDLLAALREAASAIEFSIGNTAVSQRARAAIARAEGTP